MPAHWSPRSRAGSTRVRMAAAGSCASRTSTRRVKSKVQRRTSWRHWPHSAWSRTNRCSLQSERGPHYQTAFDRLEAAQCIYGCACTRSDVELAIAAGGRRWRLSRDLPQRHGGPARRAPGVFAFRPKRSALSIARPGRCGSSSTIRPVTSSCAAPTGCGPTSSRSSSTTQRRAITDVVRGADLLDNTARQIALQRALSLPTPRYLHVDLVVNERGEKLSKQTGARALDRAMPAASSSARRDISACRASARLRSPRSCVRRPRPGPSAGSRLARRGLAHRGDHRGDRGGQLLGVRDVQELVRVRARSNAVPARR